MSTQEIIREIKRLPFSKRLLVVKKALTLLQESAGNNLEHAAAALLPDYKNDKELTAFTAIDFENFYEAR